jgi:hypothetical protein
MMRLLLVLLFIVSSWASVPHAQDVRFFYFAPIDGAGTDASPFRARCFGMPGFGQIDLRPNPAVSTGWMLCASNSLPANMSGVFQITDSLIGSVNAQKKEQLRVALGLSNVNELTAATLVELLPQLLIDLPTAKPGIWKPLRPSRVDGKYKIFIGGSAPVAQTTAWYYDRYHESDGGLRADILNGSVAVAGWIEDLLIGPMTSWAASHTEDFNCANSSGGALTCDLTWSEPLGTASLCGITSNQAACAGSGSDTARADHDTDSDDVDAQITLVTIVRGSGTDAFGSIIARKDSSATATYYFFDAEEDSVTSVYWLAKRVGGTRTDLGSDSTDPADGDVMKIRCDGSNITGYINGSPSSVGTVSDSSITGNTRAGFRYSGSDATSSVTLDDFSVQDVTAASNEAFGRRRAS